MESPLESNDCQSNIYEKLEQKKMFQVDKPSSHISSQYSSEISLSDLKKICGHITHTRSILGVSIHNTHQIQ